jgi:hypothetical protein
MKPGSLSVLAAAASLRDLMIERPPDHQLRKRAYQFDWTAMLNDGVAALAELKSLERLVVAGAAGEGGIRPGTLRRFATLPRLRVLSVPEVAIDDGLVESLADAPALEELAFTRIDSSVGSQSLTDAAADAAMRIASLRYVETLRFRPSAEARERIDSLGRRAFVPVRDHGFSLVPLEGLAPGGHEGGGGQAAQLPGRPAAGGAGGKPAGVFGHHVPNGRALHPQPGGPAHLRRQRARARAVWPAAGLPPGPAAGGRARAGDGAALLLRRVLRAHLGEVCAAHRHLGARWPERLA